MAYKILITGTLDAGKTTLLKEFEHDSRVTIVREVAQDIIDEHGYQITQKPEFQDMVFAEQLRRETEAEKTMRPFILCDRGTIDIVAFCNIIGHPIKPEWEAALHQRYDVVAFFNKDDILFQPELYDVSFDMSSYRDAVDVSIRSVLEKVNLPRLEVAGTHVERLTVFREHLREIEFTEGNVLSIEGHRQVNRNRRYRV